MEKLGYILGSMFILRRKVGRGFINLEPCTCKCNNFSKKKNGTENKGNAVYEK